MSDELRIVKWVEWQRKAIYDSTRGRARDGRLKRRLSFIALAVEFRGKEFQAFAEAVGGRSAETFWVRTIQHVGLHAPETGILTGISRKNFAQVLSRPHDSVKPGTASKVFDALLQSGLATGGSGDATAPVAGPPPESGPVPGAVSAPVPAPYTPPASAPIPAPTGPIEEPQGVMAVSCDKPCASLVTSEVDVEVESKTVVAVAVDVDRAREASAEANGPQRGAGCDRCRKGLVTTRGAPARCCDCPRGRRRALAMARAKAGEDESKRRRAASCAARGHDRPPEPMAVVLQRVLARSRPPDGRRVQVPVAVPPTS